MNICLVWKLWIPNTKYNIQYTNKNIEPLKFKVITSTRNVVPTTRNVTPITGKLVLSSRNVVPSSRNVVPSTRKVVPSTGKVIPSKESLFSWNAQEVILSDCRLQIGDTITNQYNEELIACVKQLWKLSGSAWKAIFSMRLFLSSFNGNVTSSRVKWITC